MKFDDNPLSLAALRFGVFLPSLCLVLRLSTVEQHIRTGARWCGEQQPSPSRPAFSLVRPCASDSWFVVMSTHPKTHRDYIYPLDRRPQCSMALTTHHRSPRSIHHVLLADGSRTVWAGLDIYFHRCAGTGKHWWAYGQRLEGDQW